MPEVRVIPPVAERAHKLRVAAYARVSSDSADQLNSFASQVEYYTNYIQSKDEWEFAGLYADEAVTGTSAEKRSDFQHLIQDCRAGKIDRILVKSISRFARNTLDCIQTVRELKMLGVAIEFEKEHIDTSKMGSELILSMLSAAAQEESLSISKNLKWSYQKRLRSGNFITCSAPLGYFLKDNQLIPDPEEVPIVQYIFNSYLSGKSTTEIARTLNEAENRTKRNARWHHGMIRYILTNEKYVGDSLFQKSYTPETLPLVRAKNDGQLTQYYIKNSHPAIIDREKFEQVQRLITQKKDQHGTKTEIQKFPLSGILKCGLCGSAFHRHQDQGKNRWICYQHRKNKDLCSMGIIQQEEIYQAFLTLYNKLANNPEILRDMFSDLRALQEKVYFSNPDNLELNRQIAELVRQNHSLARLQTKGCIDSALYIEKCNLNNQKIEALRKKLKQDQASDRIRQLIDKTELILELLKDREPMLEFEESILKAMVQTIVVFPNTICFHLINDLKLKEKRKKS